MNQYDSQEIREWMLEAGAREAQRGRTANIYIINTCTVTEKADRDSLYYIRRSYRQNPRALIVVTGCMAEIDSRTIRKERGVSLIVKNRDKAKIASRIMHAQANAAAGISFFEGRTRAFLKVQDGCNNFCSYCKVPFVRGVSRSKPLADIIEEAQRLVDNGYREIVLTGICLGAYGRDLKPARSLACVIDGLERIEGLWRIRLSSIEARDVSDELIRKFSASQKLCPHVHIPVQSGDNQVLGHMHRRYTRTDYIGLVKKLKACCARIAITTDVLVGFPGEEERHFHNTLDLVNTIVPLKTHIFPFSPREGTAAYRMKDRVNADILADRLHRMEAAARTCAVAYQKKFLSRVMPVLVETSGKERDGVWQGYTDNYLKVMFRSRRDLKNKLVRLRLSKIQEDKIWGIQP